MKLLSSILLGLTLIAHVGLFAHHGNAEEHANDGSEKVFHHGNEEEHK